LEDLPRSGRPPVIDDLQVVVATLAAPPRSLGVTHWSARLLAKELGISFASVARIWRDNDLKPWERPSVVQEAICPHKAPATNGASGRGRLLVPVLANQLVVPPAALADLAHGVLGPHQGLDEVQHPSVTAEGGGHGIDGLGFHLDDYFAIDTVKDLIDGHFYSLAWVAGRPGQASS
jgi:hypothetical protein